MPVWTQRIDAAVNVAAAATPIVSISICNWEKTTTTTLKRIESQSYHSSNIRHIKMEAKRRIQFIRTFENGVENKNHNQTENETKTTGARGNLIELNSARGQPKR